MATCNNCGGFVTDDYARVFGDNENEVGDCRNCPPEPRGDESTDERDADRRDPVLLREIITERGDTSASAGGVHRHESESSVGEPRGEVGGGEVGRGEVAVSAGGAEGGVRDGAAPDSAGGVAAEAANAETDGSGITAAADGERSASESDSRFGVSAVLSALGVRTE